MAKARRRRGLESERFLCGPLGRWALTVYAETEEWPTHTSTSRGNVSGKALRDFRADIGSILARLEDGDFLDTALQGDDACGLGAALALSLILVDCGYSVQDALAIADRARRVNVPSP